MRRRAPKPDADPRLELLVDCLATYRLTRLATADVLTEGARLAVLRRTGVTPTEGGPTSSVDMVGAMEDPPKAATLVTCRWCAGVWIAAGVTVARYVVPDLWRPVARGLAASAAAVLLARLEDD